MKQMDEATQVLVIGGGPAGSTAATLLAREGFRVTLFERDMFPREHIGESLLPSILTILDLLGVREKLEAHGFMKKYGGYLEWGPDQWEILFGDPDENIPGSGYGFQVVRSEFDHLLLEHAKSQGVQVYEGVKVTEVLFRNGRPKSACWAEQRGAGKGVIAFDYLIDASGRTGVMATRYLRNRRYNQSFKNVAVYSYWEGAKTPDKGPPGGLIVGSIQDGWIWGIPLHNGTLSVGVVTHNSNFKPKREQCGSVEQVYADAIAESPLIADLVAPGRCTQPVAVEQDFSYICEQSAGPGFFIVGDAACFIDPLLASGVHLATLSSLLAAAATASALRGELNEQVAATYYSAAYKMTYVRFLVLVSSLYLNYRGKESLFWEAQRMLNHDVRSIDIQHAFRHVVSGLADLDDVEGAEGSALVMSEMRRLIDSYFPKGAGKDDRWLLTLSKEEQKRVLEELRPFAAATEYCVSEETALDGLYVRTKPHLGLARAETTTIDTMTVAADAAAKGSHTQPAGPREESQMSDAIREEVAAALDHAARAYGNGDYEAFMAHYLSSEETTMVIYVPDEGPAKKGMEHMLRGIAAIRKFYADAPMFKLGFQRPLLSFEQLQVELIAPDVVNAVAVCVMSGGDPRVPLRGVTSLVMRKVNDRWQIVHDYTH